MALKSQNDGKSLSQADKQNARTSRDSKKRKQIQSGKKSSRSETRKPKRRKTTKVMPKKKRQDLLKFVYLNNYFIYSDTMHGRFSSSTTSYIKHIAIIVSIQYLSIHKPKNIIDSII